MSRKFARLPSGERIPLLRDAGTYIYLAENGSWPERPLTVLLADLFWIKEGEVLELEDLRPEGEMGKVFRARVLEVRPRVQVHQGKYGQIIRRVLVEEVRDGEG